MAAALEARTRRAPVFPIRQRSDSPMPKTLRHLHPMNTFPSIKFPAQAPEGSLATIFLLLCSSRRLSRAPFTVPVADVRERRFNQQFLDFAPLTIAI
jgi:hypothetical protein